MGELCAGSAGAARPRLFVVETMVFGSLSSSRLRESSVRVLFHSVLQYKMSLQGPDPEILLGELCQGRWVIRTS